MPNTRVKMLLLAAILIATALPLAAAFYFLDDALQTSLNLGFNQRVLRTLDIGARSLKSLKSLDPAHAAEYRGEFEEINDLKSILLPTRVGEKKHPAIAGNLLRRGNRRCRRPGIDRLRATG